ncbi:MAG: hypothetical protein KME52_09910 [Desmonostoc geniculatum HA4340-LM1]|jgi:hypothetical protein|nr:hypothetical protein [Desmonostoc geniculatum HA4340-LM1]
MSNNEATPVAAPFFDRPIKETRKPNVKLGDSFPSPDSKWLIDGVELARSLGASIDDVERFAHQRALHSPTHYRDALLSPILAAEFILKEAIGGNYIACEKIRVILAKALTPNSDA